MEEVVEGEVLIDIFSTPSEEEEGLWYVSLFPARHLFISTRVYQPLQHALYLGGREYRR